MAEEPTERWKDLCEQACYEHDPEILAALLQEINTLLEQKQHRVPPPEPETPSAS